MELDSTLFNNVSFVTATAVIRTHSRLAVGCNPGQVVYALVPLSVSKRFWLRHRGRRRRGRAGESGASGLFRLDLSRSDGHPASQTAPPVHVETETERERGGVGVLCRPSSARWRRPACCSDDVRSDEQRFSAMTFHAKDARL